MGDLAVRQESGQRVVVRFRDDDGRLRDVTGDLQAGTPGGPGDLVVLPDFAAAVVMPRNRVVAAKYIPARVVRASSALQAIYRVRWLGRPEVRHRLGGWILAVPTVRRPPPGRSRVGTRTADPAPEISGALGCLPIGDPGASLPEAVGAVQRFQADRGLPAWFEVVAALPGSGRDDPCPGLAEVLAAGGYRPSGRSCLLVAEPRSFGAGPRDAPEPPAAPGAEAVHGWLAMTRPAAPGRPGPPALGEQLSRARRLGATVAHLELAADDAEGIALAEHAGLVPHALSTRWSRPGGGAEDDPWV